MNPGCFRDDAQTFQDLLNARPILKSEAYAASGIQEKPEGQTGFTGLG